MKISEVAYKQRAFDGRWMKLGKVYNEETESLHWIILNVYDLEIEFVG